MRCGPGGPDKFGRQYDLCRPILPQLPETPRQRAHREKARAARLKSLKAKAAVDKRELDGK